MAQARQIRQLLSILDQAYDRRSWHGTNLRGSIRGVTPYQATWRPAPRRHNVWELVVHAAYWKYAAWRRLARAPRGAFPLAGSNWFRRPSPGAGATQKAWREDLALLNEMHRSLRTAVSALDPAHLYQKYRGGADSAFSLVAGAAAHDLYHAGQIQLLKRLRERR
jgi:DinB superfamily